MNSSDSPSDVVVNLVGVNILDDQHRGLFKLLAELEALASAGNESAAIVTAVDALYSYAQMHLADEEQLLKDVGYPCLAQHIAEHKLFIDSIMDIDRRLAQGENIHSYLVRTIRDWFVRHINTSDSSYAQFLESTNT